MTAFRLKIIALVAMLADHLQMAFPDIFPFWFRGIGRLAWPIFAYLLAEGFRHTKAREKFLMRLLAFGVISEMPYDIVMGNGIDFFADTNIFYTLFLGGMAICVCERLKEKYGWQTIAVMAAILPTAILAEILIADYGGMGVLFIFAMYAIQPKTPRLVAFGAFALSQFIPLAIEYSRGIEIAQKYLLLIPFAISTVPLIAMYNGQRGKGAKWLFYWAYPAHLIMLAVISVMINGFLI